METPVPLISVIMPAYNTAEFLDFAIRNVVEHQFGNAPARQWELIVVDDGSTDRSADIARQWQRRYPDSVIVVSKENRGVSAARNAGLAVARGEFVYFIDSDDILLRDSLMPLCLEAGRSGADVVKFSFSEIDTATYSSLQAQVPYADIKPEEAVIYSAADFVKHTKGLTGPPSHHATWSTIYRRGFLTNNELRFDETLSVGEDIVMTWQAMLKNPRVLYVDRALYLYHQRSGSALHLTDRRRLPELGAAYTRYLSKMLEIKGSLAPFGMNTPQVLEGLDSNFKYGYNRALCSMILGGESFGSIYRAMRQLKALGGDVHPGRPRFDKQHRNEIPARHKLRRWIVAYLLASGCYL